MPGRHLVGGVGHGRLWMGRWAHDKLPLWPPGENTVIDLRLVRPGATVGAQG